MAVVSGTNGEADAINDAIQQHRVDAGELDPTMLALGMGEQRILVGDVVQTRRNDPRTGVENRAQWVVRGISGDAITLVSASDSGDLRRVSRDYALGQVQLAYASTVHGIQGDTTDAAVVGPDVDAAGLYVGLTRGRHQNVVVAVAGSDEEAIAHIGATMMRGTTELTIQDAMRAADAELRRAAREKALEPCGRGVAVASPVFRPTQSDRVAAPLYSPRETRISSALALRNGMIPGSRPWTTTTAVESGNLGIVWESVVDPGRVNQPPETQPRFDAAGVQGGVDDRAPAYRVTSRQHRRARRQDLPA